MGSLVGNQFRLFDLPFYFRANSYHHLHNETRPKTRTNPRKYLKLLAKLDDSSTPTNSKQEVNLSVLRFTFGKLIIL